MIRGISSTWTAGLALGTLLSGHALLADDSSRWDSAKNEGPHLYEAHCSVEKDDAGLYFGGSFLFWTVLANNHDYVMFAGDGDTHFKFCDYDWDYGFRADLGWCTDHDAWSLRGRWTNISLEGRCTAEADDIDDMLLLNPLHLALVDDEVTGFEEVEVRQHFDYDCYDFVLERPTFWSETVILTPFIGGRYLTIKQHNKQDFVFDDVELLCDWRSELKAPGMMAGTEFNWHMFKNVSICGHGAASLLAGWVEDKLLLRAEEAVIEGEFRHMEDEKWEPIPGYELAIGLQWEYDFGRFYVVLKTEWEMQQWFNLSRMRRFMATNLDGDNDEIRFVSTGYVDGNSAMLMGGTLSGELHF